MKTLLVTGGAGFIGGSFVRHTLAGSSAKIVNLDKLTYAGNLDSLRDALDDDRHTFVHGDICDQSLVSQLLETHSVDAIINFAAESHVDRSIDSPAAFVETNVTGTFTLLECAFQHWKKLSAARKDSFRFLHVSTDEVYGSLGPTGAFTEESPYQPNSPYSASKAASDHFVRAYYKTFGLPVLITNCSNNYGPYQFPEKFIPLMILNSLEGKALPVYGDGQQRRDWLFVEDHCRALTRVIEQGVPGEVYNVGGNCEMTNLEVVTAVCHLIDSTKPELPHTPCESLISFVEDRPGHDRRYAIDASKIRDNLSWEPGVTFSSGLRTTIQWYIDHDEWLKQIVEKTAYDRNRLGVRTHSPARAC